MIICMSRGDILSISAISAQDDIGKKFLDTTDFGSPPTGSGGACGLLLGADKGSGGNKVGLIALRISLLILYPYLSYSNFPSIIGLIGTCSFRTFSLENISAELGSFFISIPISFFIASFPSLAPISIIWAF
jgi:hypothetical protein